MKVTLINYTQGAVDMLLFTKATRLNMTPGLMKEIINWPESKKLEELTYMANTIPSSWEFVDYTFLIEGVTRAFTHQLVRTRTASYAQQAMRVLNVSEGRGWDYDTGPTIDDTPLSNKTKTTRRQLYANAMEGIAEDYKTLVNAGVAIQDARGLLPTNILTNICMKINMRGWIDLYHKRSSPRVQDEYRGVVVQMREAIEEVHPWIHIFLDRTVQNACKDIDKAVAELDQYVSEDIDPKHWEKVKTDIIKLVDQIRTKA